MKIPGQLSVQINTAGFASAWLRHRGLDWAADMLPVPEYVGDPIPPAQMGQPKE